MVDFRKMLARSLKAQARKCPKCGAEGNKNCIALGGNLDGFIWVHFEKGTQITLMHEERYPPKEDA